MSTDTPSGAGMARALAILLLAWAVATLWEHRSHRDLQRTSGEVTSVRAVPAGRGGDRYEFTIRYVWADAPRTFTSRRGILDALGRLRNLSAGDTVGVLADPDPAGTAILDTLNARYPTTLSFGAIVAIFAGVWGWMLTTGRISLNRGSVVPTPSPPGRRNPPEA